VILFHFLLHLPNMDQLKRSGSIQRNRDSPNEESLLSSQGGEFKEPAIQSRTKTRTNWLQDWWLREIISLVVGTASIIAIAIVLRVYQDQPSSEIGSFRGFSTTLNTVISILSTISRICLLYPVAECISNRNGCGFRAFLGLSRKWRVSTVVAEVVSAL
jgi:hypothetical protein